MNKNDYAPIAPMGWNSYDYYDTTVNEEQVRANAAYLTSRQLHPAQPCGCPQALTYVFSYDP